MALDTKVSILNIDDILPNRFQPRIKFDEDKIKELAESIKKYGVIQPIIVRNIGDKYEIIAGERRYKASVMAGLKEIPTIINNLDDKDSSEIALIENVQRENLTPIEEAISIKKILDMGTKTQEQVAEKLGMSQSAIANKLRLLNLNEAVQEALLEKKISERHARSLLRITDPTKQREMLNRIINERLTVRKVDEEIQKLAQPAKEKIEQKEISSFLPKQEIENKNSLKNNEQKILDIINDYYNENEKNKEENNMNSNDPMNQFTIPSVAIENDSPLPAQDNTNNLGGQVPRSIPNPFQPEVPTPIQEQVSMNNSVSNPLNIQSTVEKGNPNTSIPNGGFSSEESKPEGKFFDILPGREMAMENQMAESNMAGASINTLNNDSIFTQVEPISNQNVNLTNENPANILENPVITPQPENIINNSEPKIESNAELSSILDKTNLISRNEMQPKEEVTPINPVPNMNMSSSIENIPPMDIPVINEQSNVAPISEEKPITSNAPLSFNMRQAINIARDTTTKIESLGVQIDTEEMDLPDCYEIIIRLMKEK